MNIVRNKKNIAFLVLLLGAMVTVVGCNTGDTDGTVVSKTDTNTTTEVVEETNTNTSVEVAVNTNEAEASEVVSEETNLTEETTSEEQSDIPADWVKYENQEHNFSLYYPVMSEVLGEETMIESESFATNVKDADDIIVGWGADIFLRIRIVGDLDNTPVLEYALSQLDTDNDDNTITSEDITEGGELIKIDGKDTLLFDGDECCYKNTPVMSDTTRYGIVRFSENRKMHLAYPVESESDIYSEEHAKLFEEILKTINF